MDMGLGGLRSWWWTGRPGVLQFIGSQRVGHNWAVIFQVIELSVIFQVIICDLGKAKDQNMINGDSSIGLKCFQVLSIVLWIVLEDNDVILLFLKLELISQCCVRFMYTAKWLSYIKSSLRLEVKYMPCLLPFRSSLQSISSWQFLWKLSCCELTLTVFHLAVAPSVTTGLGKTGYIPTMACPSTSCWPRSWLKP